MQSKALLQRIKKLERKLLHTNGLIIYFGEPSNAEFAKLPLNAQILIFVGENEIQD